MSPVHPAPIQLADLAEVMRPDWPRSDVEGAVMQARSSGWAWPKAFIEMARLMVDPDAIPRDLAKAAASPLERTGHDPAAYERGLAAVREAMAAKDGAA